jgi:signal transduction histidine kinase
MEPVDWGVAVPRWVDWLLAVVPVLIIGAAMLQRFQAGTPTWAWLWAGVALLPYLLQAVGACPPFPLYGALVLVGTAGLVLSPAKVDIAPFLLVYAAGGLGAQAEPPVGAGFALGGAGLMVFVDAIHRYGGIAPWLAGIGLGWMAGAAFRAQQVTMNELRVAQADLATKAATEERQRIAREIHDVIAHSLTVTLLHISAARLTLRSDPDEATEALLEAERFGRESLGEIRQTVGLLKAGTGGDDLGPLPNARDIASLVGEFSSAGMQVTMTVEGEVGDIATATGLALYRIVQESLSNIAKHAPGAPAALDITVGPDDIDVRVRNGVTQPGPIGSGLGLTGMKERATVLGGSCLAGPVEGGWEVRVHVPRRVA